MSAMGPSDGGFLESYHNRWFPNSAEGQEGGACRSGRDAGQGALLAVALDALQLALEPAQAGGGVVVLVAGIGEVPAHHVEPLAKLVEIPAQTASDRKS